MAKLSISSFRGIQPKTQPRFLDPSQAQVAINTLMVGGSLCGLPGTTKVRDTDRAAVKSIYRFGQDVDSAVQFWFEFTADVDVVRSAITDDTTERTFYTGDGVPKVTWAAKALTGGPAYPAAALDLGVPRPNHVAELTVTGTGTGTPETRIYIHTWVTEDGEESQPSDVSSFVNVAVGQTVEISGLPVVPTGNHLINRRRIYRSVTGSSSTAYLFVAEIAAATTTYNDSVLAASLGEACPSLTWAPPPAGLSGLVGMPGGVMAGFVGRDIYFCDPYHPFAWPANYAQTIDYPVVGLGVMDTTLAVLTSGVPYFIQGTHPDSMVPVKGDLHQACVSKRSIVSMDGSVFYASPDGIVKLAVGGSTLATEEIFTREQWQKIKPSSIQGYAWEGKYIGFYDTGAVQAGFVFDPSTGEFFFHDVYATAGFNDLHRDALYLVIGNELHTWHTGAAKTYRWRSKRFDLGAPSSMAFAVVRAEDYPVTYRLFKDGALSFEKDVQNRKPFRVPVNRKRDIEIEIEGSVEVFSLAMASDVKAIHG